MLGLKKIGRRLFGTQNERMLKKLNPLVDQINAFEKKIHPLSDAELKQKTHDFKTRIQNGAPLDQLLPEAFATVRETAIRTLGQRHYDVQLLGGIILHQGKIAEMKTGEGKTLVSTLPAYLNALTGKGVHIVTVNDYLAQRDAQWMGQIYRFLGLQVGTIVHDLNDIERQKSYAADITYGTNNEFGFDYLRDNMKFDLKEMVQRELNYVIVDEVDSILIDEARTPLIISGPSEQSTELYYKMDQKILEGGSLEPKKDYTVDEKAKTAALTENGIAKMEKRLGVKNLYDPKNMDLIHHTTQALRAHVLFKKDVDYMVRDGKVIIVDEFTGRIMPGRRWSDGLHQAIEAKERVQIENENQTLATITFQNYFRMYQKLSGMTGTADTEALEFKQIYKLDVAVIPTHRPMIRKDHADVIYKNQVSKLKAITKEIQTLYDQGQPILVGTVSVEKSELLSQHLKKTGIPHSILNAKHHEKEAEIIAQAGRKKKITISTNMAGRGTDIVLGGNPEGLAKAEVGPPPKRMKEKEQIEYHEKLQAALQKWKPICEKEHEEVKKLGGLFVLGTERHESRRIDNQLRGRSGRQGDPGASRFYLSLEDDLLRIFGGVKIQRFMEDDVPIEHKWISKSIENAQRKVESFNYDIRKHLLEYDDVMNEQRNVIYRWRKEVLKATNLKEMIFSMLDDLALSIAQEFFPDGNLPKKEGVPFFDLESFQKTLQVSFSIQTPIQLKDLEPLTEENLKEKILSLTHSHYEQKAQNLHPQAFTEAQRMMLLITIDQLWKDHLLAMDHLREGIGLRGYGQKDPLVEYKKEAFHYFEMMMSQITTDSIQKIFSLQIEAESEQDLDLELPSLSMDQMDYNISEFGELTQGSSPIPTPKAPFSDTSLSAPIPSSSQESLLQPIQSRSQKVGRNDPCPCGSGKKYKKCHGR